MAKTNKNADNNTAAPASVPTGGSTWDGSQQKVANNLITNGVYTGKLLVGKASIAKSDTPGSTPRVKGVRVEVMDNGVRKSAFHDFHTSLRPGKDGQLMPNRNGGIVEFQQCRGQFFSADKLTMEYEDDTGATQTVEYIDPQAVLDYLKQFDGADVRISISTKKGSGGYGDQSQVKAWLPDAR